MNDQTVNGLLMTDQSDDIAASLQAVLDGTHGFAETPTATYIHLALERAYTTSTITAIAGVPGVGKTTTCKRFQEQHASVWRCSFTRYTRSTYSILSTIAHGIGMSTTYRPSDLGANIEYAMSGGGLLICDEAQHLTADGFEIVRGLFDSVNDDGPRLGVALVGHVDLMEKASKLPQLLGRITSPLRIGAIGSADVDKLLDLCGVKDTKIRAFLRGHAGQSTGFRRIVNSLRDGVNYAAGEGIALTEAHVRQAWADLAGSSVK